MDFSRFLISFSLLFVSFGLSPAPAQADQLSNAFAASEPCASLQFRELGISVGVDRLREARIDEVSISMAGNAAELSSHGVLECRSSDSALVRVWVGADFLVTGSVDLADCGTAHVAVSLSRERGQLGGLLEAFRSVAENKLSSLGRQELLKLCRGVSD